MFCGSATVNPKIDDRSSVLYDPANLKAIQQETRWSVTRAPPSGASKQAHCTPFNKVVESSSNGDTGEPLKLRHGYRRVTSRGWLPCYRRDLRGPKITGGPTCKRLKSTPSRGGSQARVQMVPPERRVGGAPIIYYAVPFAKQGPTPEKLLPFCKEQVISPASLSGSLWARRHAR